MAHYAFLDENDLVIEVITGVDETETIEGLAPEEWYGNFRNKKCLRTSYNGKIRKNYAGIDYSYSEHLDAFIPPQCHDEAKLDENTCQWLCPAEIHHAETLA